MRRGGGVRARTWTMTLRYAVFFRLLSPTVPGMYLSIKPDLSTGNIAFPLASQTYTDVETVVCHTGLDATR